MQIRYDPEVDALYIRLADGRHEVRTEWLSEDIAVDYGADGRVVGIEILDASESLAPQELGRR